MAARNRAPNRRYALSATVRKWMIFAVCLCPPLINIPARPAETAEGKQIDLTELALPDPDKKRWSLAHRQGKILVVNFWASWCAPCRKELPALSQLSQSLPATQVQFIGIAIDTPEHIRQFLDKTPVPYPVLTGTSTTLGMTRTWGNTTQGLPFTAIILPDGTLHTAYSGLVDATQLRTQLDMLLDTRHPRGTADK